MSEQSPQLGSPRSPDVSSLSIEIASLRSTLEERSRRYEERFNLMDKAVDAALASADKLVKAAFDAANKAVEKAQTAQDQHNVAQNEWRGSLSDVTKNNVARTEFISTIESLKEQLLKAESGLRADVASLRESRSKSAGHDEIQMIDRTQKNWAIGIAISMGLGLVALLGTVLSWFKTH